MPKPLTKRQQRVLAIIERHKENSGAYPSYRRLAKLMGVSSIASAYTAVSVLKRRGYLEDLPTSVDRFKRKRPQLSDLRRWRIFERDGYSCRKCRSRYCLTIDHVDNAGSDEDSNLQTLCRSCNARKGSRTV